MLGMGAGAQSLRIPEAGTWTLTVNPTNLRLVVSRHIDTLLGDLNGDGTVAVEDVNALINVILDNTSPDELQGNPDLDDNGSTDVADVNILINILLEN